VSSFNDFCKSEVDSVKVKTKCSEETEQTHEGAHAEPTDIKSEN
jgi:hypothetical protein